MTTPSEWVTWRAIACKYVVQVHTGVECMTYVCESVNVVLGVWEFVVRMCGSARVFSVCCVIGVSIGLLVRRCVWCACVYSSLCARAVITARAVIMLMKA